MQEHSFAELVQLHSGEKNVAFYQLNQAGLHKLNLLSFPTEQVSDEVVDYEALLSDRQDLSFAVAAEFFQDLASNYVSLGIYNQYGQFTQLALLLSDQCPFKTEVVTSEGSRCFSGSLLQQANAVCDYLLAYNKDQLYPMMAIREAITNAFTHRDYNRPNATVIRLNANSLEFISPGGLCSGLAVEDIYAGMSMSRNPKLVEIFRKLNYVEAYGTGIRRIRKIYKDCKVQPQISVQQNSFKLVLPTREKIR